MHANKVIILARKHVGNGSVMESSARLCLEDAVALINAYDYDHAKDRAIESLKYSVGVFHVDYKMAIS